MGSIPVLNDNQMNALRRIVGANQTFDLTVAPRGKSRRLPENAEEAVSDSEYNGYFKIVDMSEYDESGNLTAFKIGVIDGGGSGGSMVSYQNGHAITVQDWTSEALELGEVYYVYAEYDIFTGIASVFATSAQLFNDETTARELIGTVSRQSADSLSSISQAFIFGLLKLDIRFSGYFATKVIEEDGNKKIKIFNSANPNSDICGKTDIGDIQVRTIGFPTQSSSSLYLVAWYDASTGYHYDFVYSKPSNKAWVEIASVSASIQSVSQIWKSGTIYFGERYYI